MQPNTSMVMAGKLPLVAVKVNGEDRPFLFDNGAPTLVINSRHSQAEATPIQAFSAGGSPQNIQSTWIPTFEWEDIRLENQMALVMDLSHMETDAQTDIHGMVGYSAIMNRDVWISYRRQQIGLIDAPHTAHSGAPVPFQMAHHFPVVPLHIGNKTLHMAINMGSCVNTIDLSHMDDFRQLGLLTSKQAAWQRGLGTRKEVEAYSLPSTLIGANGDIPLHNMLFTFDTVAMVGATIDGMLGYELFAQVDAMIRFNTRELLVCDIDVV